MQEVYHMLQPKYKTIVELKDEVHWIWPVWLQKSTVKGVKNLHKRLEACVSADGGYLNIICDH